MTKPADTLTYGDIMEIPALLEDFSRRAPALRTSALKSKDRAAYLVGRGSSGNATLFAKYIWEGYSGVITNIIHPHSIFEARIPLRFRGQAVWAFSQSGKSKDGKKAPDETPEELFDKVMQELQKLKGDSKPAEKTPAKPTGPKP